mgnify:FL=1
MEVWCIYCKNLGNGRTHKILEVRDEDGNYQPLDARTIELLQSWDTRRSTLSAEELARRQYNATMEAIQVNRRKEINERNYRAKQRVTWWARVADMLLEKKAYSDTPLKPMIVKYIEERNKRAALMAAVNNPLNRR